MGSRTIRLCQAAAALALLSLIGCGGSNSTVHPVLIQPNANLLILSTSSTGHLPPATANAPYAYAFLTNLGEAGVNAVAPVTFLPSSTLPPGLTLSSSGVLSGTPTQAGTFDVVMKAVDASPVPRTAEATFLLDVRLPAVTLTQVAHNDLGGHGQNGDITVATAGQTGVTYAYIGTRGSPGNCPATGVKIVDLTNVANPTLVATVGGVAGASQQEVRVATALTSSGFHPGSQGDLMAVTLAPCDPANADAGQEGVEFFDVSHPTQPTFLGMWSSGLNGASDVALVPAAGKLYALVAVPGSETLPQGNGEGDLRVVDISDPTRPQEIGNWGVLAATATQLPQAVMGQDQRVFLDSIQLSSDGKRAFLAYWDEGVVEMDVSDPTAIRSSNAAIVLDHIIYPTTALATSSTPSSPEGNTHMALPVVNDTELLVTDEVCASGTPLNPALAVVCGKQNSTTLDINHGWGFLRTYALPATGTSTLESFFATPEAESAPAPDQGIYTAHNIAWNGNVNNPHAYVAWFSSGIEDLDLTSIDPPTLLGKFVPPDTADPNGSAPGVNNPSKALVFGVAAYQVGGQPYILGSDINSGLWIVKEIPTSGLTILTTTVPAGNVGIPYFATLSAVNGTLGASRVTFTVASTSNPLPSGLTLDGSGNISGTPLASGSVGVTFQAQDSAGHTTQQTINFTITQNLAIVPPAPSLGTLHEPFNLTLTAVNGTAPYTFKLLNSALPNGLSLASTGAITGTPSSAGTFTTQVQVTDSSPVPQAATLPITLQMAGLQVSNTSLSLLTAAVGKSYADSVEMANGFGPFTPSVVQGALPPGLTASAGTVTRTNWLISGTPTTAGSFSFSVLLTDSEGESVTQPFVLTVNPFAITPPVLFSGVEGRGYDLTLATQGGTAPFTFNLLTGSLPPGLTLNAETGEITGVPAAGSAGTYNLGLQASDTNGLKANQTLPLVVFSGTSFAITTTGLPPATGGQNYQQSIAADFGTPPYSFSVSSGTLPAGLSLSPNGILQGVPDASTPGTFSFTVQASDAMGQRARQVYRLTVTPAAGSQ